MKPVALLAVCLCLLSLILTATTTDALPTKVLGPHVRYVDDTTVAHYTRDVRELTYLYIYSHAHMCVKCQPVGDVLSQIAQDFAGQINVIAMDAKDKFSAQTMQRLGIDPETFINYPLVFEYPRDNDLPHNLQEVMRLEAELESKTLSKEAQQKVELQLQHLKARGNLMNIGDMTYYGLKEHVMERIELYGEVKHLDHHNMHELLQVRHKKVKQNAFEKVLHSKATNTPIPTVEFPLPKAILITNHAAPPTMWDALSYQLGDNMEFFIAQREDEAFIKVFERSIQQHFSSPTGSAQLNQPMVFVLKFSDDNPVAFHEITPIFFTGVFKPALIKAFLKLHIPLEHQSLTHRQMRLLKDEKGQLKDVTMLTETENLELAYHNLLDYEHQFIPMITDQTCFQHHHTNFSIDTYGPKKTEDNGYDDNQLQAILILPRVTTSSINNDKLQHIGYYIELFKAIEQLQHDHFLKTMHYNNKHPYNFGIIPGTVLPDKTVDETSPRTFSPYGLKNTLLFSLFKLTEESYPQLVVFSPKHNKYSLFLGQFEINNIAKWLDNIRLGKKALQPIVIPPNIARNPMYKDKDVDQLLTQSFFNIQSSRCANLITKRVQEQLDQDRLVEQQQKDFAAKEQVLNTASTPHPEQRWYRPFRPLTKKGQIVELTDEYFETIHAQRSVVSLIIFSPPPPGFDINAPTPTGVKHDFYTFKDTIEGLNGMVQGYYVQCDDNSKTLRQLFGLKKKSDCTGGIYGLPGKSQQAGKLTFDEYYNHTALLKIYQEHVKLFEINKAEVKSPTRTFTQNTLKKFALDFFKDSKALVMPHSQNALQTHLLQSLEEPRVFIFTKKTDMILPRALVVEFWSFARIVLIDSENHGLIHQFQITEFPSVRILLPKIVPRQGGQHGESGMSLEIIPIPKNQLYYNAIASHLDQHVGKRYIGATAQKGHAYEELRNEHPVDTMFRQHEERRQASLNKKSGGGRDEL